MAVQPGARVHVLQPHARARLERRPLRALLALRRPRSVSERGLSTGSLPQERQRQAAEQAQQTGTARAHQRRPHRPEAVGVLGVGHRGDGLLAAAAAIGHLVRVQVRAGAQVLELYHTAAGHLRAPLV